MDRKLQRHRADSLRQHGFLVLFALFAISGLCLVSVLSVFFDLSSGWLTTLLQCFDTVGWVIRPVKKPSAVQTILCWHRRKTMLNQSICLLSFFQCEPTWMAMYRLIVVMCCSVKHLLSHSPQIVFLLICRQMSLALLASFNFAARVHWTFSCVTKILFSCMIFEHNKLTFFSRGCVSFFAWWSCNKTVLKCHLCWPWFYSTKFNKHVKIAQQPELKL